MKIGIVASEAVPFAKTGGLADVSGALASEFAKQGHRVFLFHPLYRESAGHAMTDTGLELDIPLGRAVRKCRVFTLDKAEAPSCTVFFIANEDYFGRDELYGTSWGDYPDNDQRFTFFCRSVMEISVRLGLEIDVFHCNDWQSGLVPLYLKTLYRHLPIFGRSRSVLTIHNLGYQGLFDPRSMELTGLGWEHYTMEGMEFYGKANFLKAGIVGADAVTTVSETYAGEILTPEHGFGLEGVLNKKSDVLFGIPNGIDYGVWDPSSDPLLPVRFGPSSANARKACKEELLRRCGLSCEAGTPLAAYIGRLSEQKGIDLLTSAMGDLIAGGVKLVIIGKGDERYRQLLESWMSRHPDDVFFTSSFNEPLAHLCYAGADLFLMPSRYEPCGLGQLIAMHYGAIPVARRTGGLADTIRHGETGFLFQDYSVQALVDCAGEALQRLSDRSAWGRMIRKAMRLDVSWKKSADQYLKLFSRLNANR